MKKGKLFVIATPIGNLEDITLRAINTLKDVDVIFAENPNHSRRLLQHYDINKKMVQYNEHNEKRMMEYALRLAEGGSDIGLISDAGTPTIQDPGYRLIETFLKNDLEIIPIPGVSAAITALSASGLPTDKFLFIGFLPKGPVKKRKFLKNYDTDTTLIIYESPNRVIKTLEAVCDALGEDREIVVARELTKIYEQFIRGKAKEVLDEFKSKDSIKGEFVILIKKA